MGLLLIVHPSLALADKEEGCWKTRVNEGRNSNGCKKSGPWGPLRDEAMNDDQGGHQTAIVTKFKAIVKKKNEITELEFH